MKSPGPDTEIEPLGRFYASILQYYPLLAYSRSLGPIVRLCLIVVFWGKKKIKAVLRLT